MRLKIKIFLCVFFWVALSLDIFIMIYLRAPWYSLASLAILVLTFLISKAEKSVFTSPSLGKRIVHESGEYYVSYRDGKEGYSDLYVIYSDSYLFKTQLFEVNTSSVSSESDILRYIKSTLDDRYSNVLRKRKKKELLEKWDGYTSPDLKRDDKISQVIK